MLSLSTVEHLPVFGKFILSYYLSFPWRDWGKQTFWKDSQANNGFIVTVAESVSFNNFIKRFTKFMLKNGSTIYGWVISHSLNSHVDVILSIADEKWLQENGRWDGSSCSKYGIHYIILGTDIMHFTGVVLIGDFIFSAHIYS